MTDDPRFTDYWAAIRADLNKQTVDAVIRLADNEQEGLRAEVERWKTAAAEFEAAYVSTTERAERMTAGWSEAVGIARGWELRARKAEAPLARVHALADRAGGLDNGILMWDLRAALDES